MKKLIFSTIFLCLSATFCFGQKPKTPAKTPPNPIQIQSIVEIPDAEWKTLADALTAEDWGKSVSLTAQFISRFKIDNEKKQLAQLRYIYLYALAGKILKTAAEKNNAGEQNAAWEELNRAAARFANKEFLLPPRQYLGDCRKVFNYICTIKNDDRALRSVATDKNGTEIHSFDYVRFDRKIDFKEFRENKTFIGGILKKVEFNADLSKPWVMRLVFDKGFVRVVI